MYKKLTYVLSIIFYSIGVLHVHQAKSMFTLTVSQEVTQELIAVSASIQNVCSFVKELSWPRTGLGLGSIVAGYYGIKLIADSAYSKEVELSKKQMRYGCSLLGLSVGCIALNSGLVWYGNSNHIGNRQIKI